MPHRFHHGWIADVPDHRDRHYEAPAKIARKLPRHVDLREKCPPVYNQGRLHSCTANAIAAAIQFEQMKRAPTQVFRPSRLFIYYNERALERSIPSDSGAQIRNGMKTIAQKGVCPEHLWPYRPRRFRDRPHRKSYAAAAKHPCVEYYRVHRTLKDMKACLASGYPFVFGFSVYESLHSKTVARTGRGAMPAKRDQMRGGHAVLAVGYDERERHFIVRNSWGKRWAIGGYFTLPFDYLLHHHLSEDFWTIRLMS